MYSTQKKDGDIFVSFTDDAFCEEKVYGFLFKLCNNKTLNRC